MTERPIGHAHRAPREREAASDAALYAGRTRPSRVRALSFVMNSRAGSSPPQPPQLPSGNGQAPAAAPDRRRGRRGVRPRRRFLRSAPRPVPGRTRRPAGRTPTCRARPPRRTISSARGPTSSTLVPRGTRPQPGLIGTADYFDALKTWPTTASGNPKDRFHFTYPTDEWVALAQSGSKPGTARSGSSSRRGRRGRSWWPIRSRAPRPRRPA